MSPSYLVKKWWNLSKQKLLKTSHATGWMEIFEIYPIPWDEKFLKSIPSHGTKQFLKVSHGIPWDEYFLQNFDFIMNSITVFVIDGSLANPGRKIRLSDPIGKLSDSAGTHRKLTESLVSDSNSFLSVVVKCRNSVVPTLSDIRQLLSESGAKDFDNFRQDLVGIIGIRWGDFDLGFQPIQVRYKWYNVR